MAENYLLKAEISGKFLLLIKKTELSKVRF